MKKDIKFSTRMASADREKIKALAAKAHMSMSDYVTACCLGKRIVVIDEQKELLRQLKGIGSNINRLTVLANMDKVQVIGLDKAAQELSEVSAALLVHHLRKELADDVFSRISGTTAISGAVDSSFTLVEDKLGSGKAILSCIGRDIEYRELMLERNAENVWELVSDSRTQPELLGGQIVILLSELMRDRAEFIGTPTELSAQIDPVGSEGITPKKVSRLILQSVAALSKIGISAVVRRSNGKRLIELRRAESDDAQGTQAVDPIDPADVSGGENAPCFAP